MFRKKLNTSGVYGRIARGKTLLSKKNIGALLKFAKEQWISQKAIGRMLCG